ncbi:TolB family protein [Rossellomorea sp. NPDC071047]|uniref:TolB family protein n=1 Tax=Rossellomorea sp. NPDC071047 TaxID=3390675 RepID=UPI003D044C90
MRRIMILSITFFLLFPDGVKGSTPSRAAFVRDGNVFTLLDGKEMQITSSGTVHGTPQWSHDGKWILYELTAPSEVGKEVQNELWVYNIANRIYKKIFYDGYEPKWSPITNMVSFLQRDTLDVSDLKSFYNIASGVSSYSWLRDGSGFLLSSQATLHPDGWSNPKLYMKTISFPLDNLSETKNVKPFFTIPKNVGDKNSVIESIDASHIRFSPSQKWISFIVSPTASWSMDSNMLSVISHKGEEFQVLGEVIFGVGEPKWAPNEDTLAYIAGGGRIVFGFKNKKLKTKEFPAFRGITPKTFSELDFTWVNKETLVTSRVKEKEWSNDFSLHPLPSLYQISLQTTVQEQITEPPKLFGDYNPQYLPSSRQLLWFRGKSITDEHRDVWLAEKDGKNPSKWLENVSVISVYE